MFPEQRDLITSLKTIDGHFTKLTHQFKLDDIVAAYGLFAHQRDGVLKVAIKP
jgi:uncharacterized protein YdcH (DUF465 family)